MNERHDIVIIGGGLVGSSLAIALDGCGLRVALVEAARPQVSAQPSYDERNLALARASINALQALGVWAHTNDQATAIERIHVSRRGEFGAVRLDASQLGLPAFGAVLPARELGNALLRRLDACRSLARVAPAQLIGLASRDDGIEATLRSDDGERRLSARLLVGADGTESFVRGHFGIGAQGFNLGLRDALHLSEAVIAAGRDGRDPGSAELLAAYAARRAPDRETTTAFSDDLVRLMGVQDMPIGLLRSLGFAALDRLPPLKRRFALRGMGFRGDVAELALSR